MERIINTVPISTKNFVIALAKADGLTEIEVIPDGDGTVTIIARKPATEASQASASRVSEEAAAFMLTKERFVSWRYADVDNNATIGYGHHRSKTSAQIDAEFPVGLTETEAWTLFLKDIAVFADIVIGEVGDALTQHQFDALVMVAFQTGNIRKLADDVRAGRHDAVSANIEAIQTAGGRFNRGVADRMRAVAGLYRHNIRPRASMTRADLKAQCLRDTRRLFPNRLDSIGNRFGRPSDPAQIEQAEQAFFRMTGENV